MAKLIFHNVLHGSIKMTNQTLFLVQSRDVIFGNCWEDVVLPVQIDF